MEVSFVVNALPMEVSFVVNALPMEVSSPKSSFFYIKVWLQGWNWIM